MNIAYNLNAWLSGMAKKMNLSTIGLVSEIPFYNPEGPNIRACRTLVTTLSQMLELEIDVSDLDRLLAEEEMQLEQKLGELGQSTDERVVEFLQYLEELKGMRKPAVQAEHFPRDEKLPQSLNYIEELYVRVKQDKSMLRQLKVELERLDQLDRLLILRKYGDELLKLLGEPM